VKHEADSNAPVVDEKVPAKHGVQVLAALAV
jgi:hypothetical protein